MSAAHASGRGLSSALRFLRAAREDRALAERLAQLDPQDGLEPVLRLAAAEGFDLRADELRVAHRVDWGLRRARYADAGSAASAPSTVAVVKSESSSR